MRPTLKADLLLLLVTLLAAAGWMFSKETLQGLPPLLFIGIRFLLAGVVLLLMGRRLLRKLTLSGIKRALATGSLLAVAMMVWISALHITPSVGEGAFITSLGAVLVPISARLLFAERPDRSVWLSIPIATVGLAMLSLNRGFTPEPSQLLFLTAAMIFSVHFCLNTRAVALIPAITLTGIQLVVVGVSCLTVSAGVEQWPQQVEFAIWGWLLASALLATSLRFFIQTTAQGLTSASHAALILTIEPIWTAILASWWLAESMTMTQASGCALIFSALLVSRWTTLKQLFQTRHHHA